MDKYSPLELREKVESSDEAELSATIEDTEPEPDAETVESEELSGTNEELEEFRAEMAEELERSGWNRQAEKLREGTLDPVDFE